MLFAQTAEDIIVNMKLLLYVYKVLLRVIFFLIYPFKFWISEKKRKCVPLHNDDLLNISATKLAELIRKQKISSEDVVRAYIKRIKEVNHLINAVVEERFEDAIKEAKSVTDYLRTTSLLEDELRKIKPLLGVPVTIKESCMLSGLSYAVGTVLRKGLKANADGDVVARVKMSGAIPLLVSNTPELCMSLFCDNKVTGTTNNPHDITRTSGASSAGEAALLGAGASVIGIGSDFAGSIRFPAMCCGVFGHKPSPKIIPLRGHFPCPTNKRAMEHLTIGPMVRYAEDLRLLMAVMSGKQAVELDLHEKVDLSQLRVFYLQEFPPSFINSGAQIEIKNAVCKSAEYLERYSDATKVDICPFTEGFKSAFELSSALITDVEGVPSLLKGQPNESPVLEIIRSLLGQSKFSFGYLNTLLQLSFKDWFNREKQIEICKNFKQQIMMNLGNNGVFICPTFPVTAPKHGEGYLKYDGIMYLQIFNVLGLPATQVPCGKTADGLPIGIQVVAAPNQDRLCFAVAEELEKCFGGWLPPVRPKIIS